MSTVPSTETALAVFLEKAGGIARSVSVPQLIAEARDITITDDESFIGAGTVRAALKGAQKVAEQRFEEVKKPLREAKAAFDKMESEVVGPIKSAVAALDDKTTVYRSEQLRLAEEKRKADEAAARKLEEERRLKEAEAAKANGVPEEETLALLDEPLMPTMAPAAPATPKVAGQSYVDTWSAEVTNLSALIGYVAAAPRERGNLLLPNLPALNQVAKGMKAAMAIPGVRAVSRQTVRGRAAG